MDEEFVRLSEEIKEKLSRGENVDTEMERLNEMTNQKLIEANEATMKEAYKKLLYGLHQMGEEFIQKENHTMKEYNKILSLFDDTREKVNIEGHFYFEEIYFIINVNILTPLVTIDNINDSCILYEKFMNKAIETAENDEDRGQLQTIYNNDINKIKSAIEDRRNNYPTIREKITTKQCLHCLRTISINSDFCEYCGK